MNNYISELIRKYKTLGILIDTNILLMYFVGLCDPKRIPVFKRTNTYRIEDFSTLDSILSHFKKVVTTPNILTEVSNLAGQLTDPLKSDFFKIFGEGIQLLEENYIPSCDISETNQFVRFGLTDSAIIQLVKGKYLVLTDEFPLAGFLKKEQVDVLNFNNIRTDFWQ